MPGTLTAAWRYRAPRPVRGLSVAHGLVLIGTESPDAEKGADGADQRGSISALDAASGELRWSRWLPSWVHGDPALYRGRVFVAYGRWPMTMPGGIMALDERTGRVLWNRVTTTGNMPAPTIDSVRNELIVAGGDGVLYSLSPETGAILHAAGLRSPVAMSSPRITSSGTLFVGTGVGVTSYSLRDRVVEWEYRPRRVFSIGDIPVALTDTVVFTTGGTRYGMRNAAADLPLGHFLSRLAEAVETKKFSTYRTWFQQQWLLAVDRRSGRLLWREPLGIGLSVPRNTAGTPVVSHDAVYVSSPVSETLWSFDARTGRPRWHVTLDARHKGAVTVVGDEVLLGDRAGHVHLYRAADGAPVGECTTSGSFTVLAPLLVGGTLFSATNDGWVRATPYASLRRRAIAHERDCL